MKVLFYVYKHLNSETLFMPIFSMSTLKNTYIIIVQRINDYAR